MCKSPTPAAIVAMSVGLGAALASSMGPTGWIIGFAAGIVLIWTGKRTDRVR